MISDIIKQISENDLYGVSENMEIAKGNKEYITSWIDFKRKIKRQWLLRKL